ncbi:MAG: HD domain-containing protein [Desulfobacterales bacterium]
MSIQPIDLINAFYPPGTKLRELLLIHSRAVAERALAIAGRLSHLGPDMTFIREAALLHDIGIYLTNAASIGCSGTYPYICHGYLGRRILEEKGLYRHALVCERHVGVGLTAAEIRAENLPLPERNMLPVSLEEKIICYADKFFSKKPGLNGKPLAFEAVLENVAGYGPGKADRLLEWAARFEGIGQTDSSSAGVGR